MMQHMQITACLMFAQRSLPVVACSVAMPVREIVVITYWASFWCQEVFFQMKIDAQLFSRNLT